MTSNFILDQDITEVIKLECMISDYLAQTNHCYTHFDFTMDSSTDEYFTQKLKIITYNRIHQKSFLLKELVGENHLELLQTAFNYIKETIKEENKYIVDWTDIETGEKHISYFRGVDISEIKSKLYYSVENITHIRIDMITKFPIS